MHAVIITIIVIRSTRGVRIAHLCPECPCLGLGSGLGPGLCFCPVLGLNFECRSRRYRRCHVCGVHFLRKLFQRVLIEHVTGV